MENSSNRGLVVLLIIVSAIAILALGLLGYQYLSDNENNATQNEQDVDNDSTQDNQRPDDSTDQTDTDTNDDTENEITLYFYDPVAFDAGESSPFIEVTRTTERTDVAAYAVEQIIFGPTEQEETDGAADSFGENTLAQIDNTAQSTCAGGDFTIVISNGDATVQFCRPVMLAGDLSGSIIRNQIEMTLKQFDSVNRVRILNNEGLCFDDLSGMQGDQCYR